MLVGRDDGAGDLRPPDQLDVALRDEIGADLGRDIAGAVRVFLGKPDPFHRRMAVRHLAAEQPDPPAADDRKPDVRSLRSHASAVAGLIARPVLRLEIRDRRDRLVGQRQIDRRVAIGGQVGRRVGFHHHARAFRRHHHRLVLDAGFQEVDRLRPHAAGEHVIDLLARHGRHREHLAVLLRVEPVVALGVVENERAFGAGDLDPGRAVVRIVLREIPAAADHHHHAVVHRHGGEHHVVRAVDRLHVAVGALRIDPHRLGGLQQPHHEVEVVRRFHHHRRQPHAAGDLLAEPPRQMPADQHGHDLAERAVDDLLLGVGDLGVESLRIADGEFQVVAPGEHDQLVGLPQLQRDRLLQHHVLAGLEAVARDRIVVDLRRGRDEHHRDVVVLDDVLVVERRGRGPVARLQLGQTVRLDVADVQLVDQRRARQRFHPRAANPTHANCTDFNCLHAIRPFR